MDTKSMMIDFWKPITKQAPEVIMIVQSILMDVCGILQAIGGEKDVDEMQ